MRTFKYSTESYKNISRNHEFQFAANHALSLYQGNSIYSFIPKNACSTLRLSLAVHNGFVNNLEDFNWIHDNNDTFKASIQNLVLANYTFVILRCPFARLVSAYLDKIVRLTVNAWSIARANNHNIEPYKLTFYQFVKMMTKPRLRNSDIHWRAQTDFLVYDKYDDYFCLENFGQAIVTLKSKIGLEVIDARKFANHGNSHLNEIVTSQKSWDISALELLNLKVQGQRPTYVSFYSEELICDVKEAYKNDIQLYSELFGSSMLMFPE